MKNETHDVLVRAASAYTDSEIGYPGRRFRILSALKHAGVNPYLAQCEPLSMIASAIMNIDACGLLIDSNPCISEIQSSAYTLTKIGQFRSMRLDSDFDALDNARKAFIRALIGSGVKPHFDVLRAAFDISIISEIDLRVRAKDAKNKRNI